MFFQIFAFRKELLLVLYLINLSVGQITYEKDISFSPSGNCATPDGQRGNCVRWTKCLSLSQQIKDWDQLKQYLCGFVGNEPTICCPSSLQPDISSPTVDRISPPTSNNRVTNTTSEHIPVVSIPKTDSSGSSNHKYEKPSFLPESCGSFPIYKNVVQSIRAGKGYWPYMAAAFEVKRSALKIFKCGGALVTARHVITSAHCVVERNSITPLNPNRLVVRLGAHNLRNETETDAIDIGVDDVRMHEMYDPIAHTNDIAVLHLSQPVPFSDTIMPVCLPYDSLRDSDLSERTATVTGFRFASVNGSSYNTLMNFSFDILDQEACERSYALDFRITNRHLCAGTLDGSKEACVGDSGDPLVIVGSRRRYYLVGIVSFKKKCSLFGYPDVYTRVTEYLDWLTPRLAD